MGGWDELVCDYGVMLIAFCYFHFNLDTVKKETNFLTFEYLYTFYQVAFSHAGSISSFLKGREL